MRRRKVRYEFVEFIPSLREDGVVYITIKYSTAVHSCCCGCGNKVVTPISPTDWKLTFDGESISLSPSIGSWSLPCQSHYWITNNKVIWASKWSKERIESGREHDALDKEAYFQKKSRRKGKPRLPSSLDH